MQIFVPESVSVDQAGGSWWGLLRGALSHISVPGMKPQAALGRLEVLTTSMTATTTTTISITHKKVIICIVLSGCFDKVVIVAFYADHHIVIMIIMSGKPVFIAPKSDHCLALVSHFSC